MESHLLTRRRLLAVATTAAAAGAFARSPVSPSAASAAPSPISNVFASPEELYETFGKAVGDLIVAPAGERFRALNSVVAIDVVEPSAQLALLLNPDRPAVQFATDPSEADVRLTVAGDLAHALASGELPIEEAMFDSNLRWSGRSPEQIQAMAWLPGSLVPFYRDSLRAANLSERIPKPIPPVFSSAEQLYATVGRAIKETVLTTREGETYRQVGKRIALRFEAPASEINLTLTTQPKVDFAAGTNADASVNMSGDAAHRLFSGALGFTEAVGRGHLIYEGRSAALPRIATLPALVRPRYKELARAAGLSEGSTHA